MVVFSTIAAGTTVGVITSAVASWMGLETYRDYQKEKNTKLWYDWSISDVADFVAFLGPESKRWDKKYPALILRYEIDGETLAGYTKTELERLGFHPKDAAKVLRAFGTTSHLSKYQSMRQKENQFADHKESGERSRRSHRSKKRDQHHVKEKSKRRRSHRGSSKSSSDVSSDSQSRKKSSRSRHRSRKKSRHRRA